MREATKKLIRKALNNEIKRLKDAVEHCKLSPQSVAMSAHIGKLKDKIWKLNEAIEELDVA